MNERALAVLRRFRLPTSVPDNSLNTPLHFAALNGKERAVQSLIDVGEHVESKNILGQTPLHLACSRGWSSAVKMLIRKGRACIDAHDDDGCRPLTHAAINGHEDVVTYLLSEGAAIDLSSHDGVTPLMESIRNDQFDVLETLLENGADVDLMDQSGQTALHMAVGRADMEMISLLLDYGADPMAEDFGSMTPLDLAEYMDDHEMVEMLQDGVDDVSDDPSDVDSTEAIAERLGQVMLHDSPRREIKQNRAVVCGRRAVTSNTHVGIDDASIEELITCPITLDVMQDPVMAPDGYWYERSAITGWLQSHGTSPLTKQRMSVECLMPIRPLKHFIQTHLNNK